MFTYSSLVVGYHTKKQLEFITYLYSTHLVEQHSDGLILSKRITYWSLDPTVAELESDDLPYPNNEYWHFLFIFNILF